MNTTIDQMLTNVYELEGLLLVMQRHNDNVPQLVIDRFQEKAQQIAAMASVLDSLKKPSAELPDAPLSQPTAPPAQPEKPAAAPPAQPEKPAAASPAQPEKPAATPPAHPEKPAAVPPSHPERPAVAPPAHPEPPIFAPSAPVPPSSAPVAPPVHNAKEPVIEPEPDIVIDPVPETDTESYPERVCVTKPIMRRDEPFAPEEAPLPDITSAFSINDRFLFTRELFDNNKQKYDDAIAVMQRLADIDKIKEFITDALGFDSNNDNVKEFVRLIELSLKG